MQAQDAPRWEPLTPEQVRDLLRDVKVPWFVAGGWALDLFLGRATRAHSDIDIAVFRADLDAVKNALRGWEFEENQDQHSIRSRERGKEAWQLEILVEEREGDRWVYRRNKDIGVRAVDVGRTTPDGIPYIRPEIQLLYKSASARASDETDFLTLLPRLDPAQKAFLSAGLWTTKPGHRWLGRLG